jgi:hypothetical protein
MLFAALNYDFFVELRSAFEALALRISPCPGSITSKSSLDIFQLILSLYPRPKKADDFFDGINRVGLVFFEH